MRPRTSIPEGVPSCPDPFSFTRPGTRGTVTGGALGAPAVDLRAPLALHLGATAIMFSVAAPGIYRFLLQEPEPHHLDTGTAHAERQSDEPTRQKRAGVTSRYALLAALVVIATFGALLEDAGS